MPNKLFIRSVKAREQVELFIVSAVSSLLLLRYYLYLTGYPQVGNGSLHIAHMLYGGLFMMIALVLQLSFLGRRIQRFCAFFGGIGFGIFIDEIGKFLTRDNNYFFRPSIGIIYAIFVLLYLGLSFITRQTRFTSIEYQLNALTQLEEAILREMDEREKQEVQNLLRKAGSGSSLTHSLKAMVAEINATQTKRPNVVQRTLGSLDSYYRKAWQSRTSNMAVRLFFAGEIAVFLLAVTGAIINNAGNVRDFFMGNADYGHSLIIGQAIGTMIATSLAVRGLIALPIRRTDAFEWFRRATLVNLLFTEFFIFSRIQFGAITGFVFNLVLLFAINFVLSRERRGQTVQASD